MIVRELLASGSRRLQEAGLEQPVKDAEWLLGWLLGETPTGLYLREEAVPAQTVERFASAVDARARGTPLQYLLGEADFYGARFAVRPGGFIPRPETECIVEAALTALRAQPLRNGKPLRLLDLGSGSGCIAITLARRLPACVVVGVELSWDALTVARQNARALGVASRVLFVQGSWLDAFRGAVDGVIANPPYVSSGQVERLPLDVRQEPRVSLDGGADGMRDLRRLLDEMPRVLKPGGIAVLECGEEQVSPLAEAAASAGWTETVTPLQDLGGRPRGLLAIRAHG